MPMPTLTPCLTFVGEQLGRADEAMEMYVSLFPNSRIVQREHYGPGEDEPAGTIKQARFSLNGQEFRAMDSGREHHFAFTPALCLRERSTKTMMRNSTNLRMAALIHSLTFREAD